MVDPIKPEPRASLRNAIDKKCRDCGATDAGAHWRLHVAACPVTNCALWPVRPLPKNAPQWLASRDPNGLPTDWPRMSIETAIRSIGGTVTRLPGAAAAIDHSQGQPSAGPYVNPGDDGASDG
jgi:hypothetical protein